MKELKFHMVTDQANSNQAQETFTQTDNSVEARKAVSDKLLSIHNVTTNRFWQFAALSAIMFAFGIVGYILRLSSGFDDKRGLGILCGGFRVSDDNYLRGSNGCNSSYNCKS